MNEIRDAILADQLDAVAGLAVPESYRAVVVRKDEQDMFDGLTAKDKDPRKSLHVEEVPTPELGPGEALVAVMATSSTTTPCGPRSSSRCPPSGSCERYGRLSELTKRHDLPYHVVGSDLAGVVLRIGPGVNRWKPGDEVVAHCLSVELEDPAGPRRHDDGPAAADLGLRDQLRRPGRAGPGQGQPADAQAGPPDLGGGRRPGAGQLHRLPAAGLATTART